MSQNTVSATINRDEVLIGQIAVSVTRYLQKLHFDGESDTGLSSILPSSVAQPEGTKGRKREKFTNKEFRLHSENIREMVEAALNRYADDLFTFLVQEMIHSGLLNEKGDGLLLAIPQEESAQKRWLKKALRKWKSPYPLT